MHRRVKHQRHSFRSSQFFVIGSFGVTLLLILLSIQPASAASATLFSRPFTGQGVGATSGAYSGCGNSVSYPVVPVFNMTTGHGKEVVKAKARSCGSTGSSVLAYAYVGLLSSWFTTTTGTHELIANWTLSFSVNLSAIAGNSSQRAYGAFQVYPLMYLYDKTSGASFNQSNYPSAYALINSNNLSRTYSKLHFSIYLNGSLVAKHNYQLETYAEVLAETIVSSGKCSASSLVNVGTGGKHASLDSISIS